MLDNGTRFPNLALMKLSGYHKEIGNETKLITNCEDVRSYDKVYLSKVFKFSKTPVVENGVIKVRGKDIKQYIEVTALPNVQHGGTGFGYDPDPSLPYEIEHHMPDYHLYDAYVQQQKESGNDEGLDYYTDHSIGFVTRGCFRKCDFCVNKHYDKVVFHAPVEEFFDQSRKYICLLDDNILGYPGWSKVVSSLVDTNRHFQFKQGVDIRLMTPEKAKQLASVRYKGDFIFAFDDIEDKEIISEKIKLWKTHYTKGGNTKLYVLCAFDRSKQYDSEFWKQDVVGTFERIRILMKYGCIPYVMRYERYVDSPYRGMYITIARWANQPSLFKKKSFRDFVYIADGVGREHKQYASKRYLEEFERQHPDIAKKYFDMRYEDIREM